MQHALLVSIVKVKYAKSFIKKKQAKNQCAQNATLVEETLQRAQNASLFEETPQRSQNAIPVEDTRRRRSNATPCRGNAATCSECDPCQGNATQALKWDPCRGNSTEMFKRRFLSAKLSFSVQNAIIVAQIASEPSECKILQKSD